MHGRRCSLPGSQRPSTPGELRAEQLSAQDGFADALASALDSTRNQPLEALREREQRPRRELKCEEGKRRHEAEAAAPPCSELGARQALLEALLEAPWRHSAASAAHLCDTTSFGSYLTVCRCHRRALPRQKQKSTTRSARTTW